MNHIENFHLYQIVTDASQAHDFLIAKNPELSPDQRFDLLKTMLEVTGQRASADAISIVLSNGLEALKDSLHTAIGGLGMDTNDALTQIAYALSNQNPGSLVEQGLVYLADSISSGLSGIDDALTRHANKK